MKKILNYIAQGQGLGVKFLLLFSTIVALIFALYIRFAGTDLIPYAQDIADQMLPIKVENGVVVEPANTIRVAQLRADEISEPMALPIVINTTVDNLDSYNYPQGVYLTRKAFYLVNANETRVYNLENSFDLPAGDYREDFKSGLSWAALAFFVLGGIFLFAAYFLLSIFYATCSYAVSALASKKFNFDLRMRLSILCLITTYIFLMLLGWAGIESGRLVFFIFVIALQVLVIRILPKQTSIAEALPQAEAAPAQKVTSAWPETSITEAKTEPKKNTTKKMAVSKTPAKKAVPAKKATAKAKPTTSPKVTAAPKKKPAAKKTDKK